MINRDLKLRENGLVVGTDLLAEVHVQGKADAGRTYKRHYGSEGLLLTMDSSD